MLKSFLVIVVLSNLIGVNNADAARKIEEKDYFASIRASKANIRSGPGKHYPVKFTFNARDIPVHVISEYDNWNEVKDYQGHTGWISKALLTKRRSLMVVTSSDKNVSFYSKKDSKSRVLFYLKRYVVGEYLKCDKKWCRMKVKGKKGWVRRGYLFGD